MLSFYPLTCWRKQNSLLQTCKYELKALTTLSLVYVEFFFFLVRTGGCLAWNPTGVKKSFFCWDWTVKWNTKLSKVVIQFFIRHCCNSWIVYSDESTVWDLSIARYHHFDWSLVRPRDGGLHVSMLGQVLKESKHLIPISRFGGFLLVFCDMWDFPSAELKWMAACKTFLICYGIFLLYYIQR